MDVAGATLDPVGPDDAFLSEEFFDFLTAVERRGKGTLVLGDEVGWTYKFDEFTLSLIGDGEFGVLAVEWDLAFDGTSE